MLPLPFLLAQAEAAPGTPGNPPFILLIGQFAFIIIIFYFLLVRPQRKRQKEHQNLISQVKPGDRIVTAGGVHGIVAQVKEKTVMVKIADNVRIELDKASIGSVLPAEVKAEAAAS